MNLTHEAKEVPPDTLLEKSPYEASWVSRLFFGYMSDAMTLANKRTKEGSSLKGNVFAVNLP